MGMTIHFVTLVLSKIKVLIQILLGTHPFKNKRLDFTNVIMTT